MPDLANPNASPPPSPGEGNLQPGIIVTTLIVTVLVDTVVALRLVTRKWIVKSIGWDDWTIIMAALLETIGCALVMVEIRYGFGRHKSDLPQEEYLEFLRYSYGEWIQTFAVLMFTKISICFFLLRIVISKAFIQFLRALIATLALSNIGLTILWILQCRPVYLAWVTPEIPLSCLSETELQKIILAQAIISIASDFILATCPILILRKIQMPMRVKVGLCALMGLGIITGSFCIVRTVSNWQNVNDDPTWNSVNNWYFRCWEVCIGIIAASVPPLRPGYKKLKTSIRNYVTAHSTNKTSVPDQSEKSSKPSHVEAVKPVPTAVLRPDRGIISTTATAEDGLRLPQQNFGILKTTKVDLESQRTSSGGVLSSGDSYDEIDRMDSQAELRGAGTLM